LRKDLILSARGSADRRVRPLAFACLVTAALLCASAIGSTGATDSTVSSAGDKAPVVRAGEKADLYDIDASGTDIRLVLEMLARRSGANIVVGPEVTGETNAHLKQMTVDAILEQLAAVQGFSYQKNGTTYLVAGKSSEARKHEPEAGPPPPPDEVLVWECKHVSPADLVGAVKELFPSVKAVEGPGTATPELRALTGAVQEKTGGSTGTSTQESSGTKQNGTRIVLLGAPNEIARARDLLSQLDRPRPQVEIQVAITEINSSVSKEIGIQWSWTDIGIKETADTGIGFGKFTKEGITVTAALSALLKDGRARILAQPKISVLDSETAEILIGDRILFPKLIGYNQVGAPLYDKEEERVGIYLQIAPRVAGDGEIVMTLYPQVSLVTGFLKTQGGDYPQISTREARTTVSVKGGETLAIGGLLRDNEVANTAKFPVLGDLPIIGHLFRHTKKTKERTEIVILLSPKIAGSETWQPIP
jgi:type II secretory pathway component GspD/PulD (secretin)